MKSQSKLAAPSRETPLEEGLRRYAPKDGAERTVAVSDFIVSLLMMGGRSGRRK